MSTPIATRPQQSSLRKAIPASVGYPESAIGPGKGDLFGQYDGEFQSWVMSQDPDTIVSPWTDYYMLWKSNDSLQGRLANTYESKRWSVAYRDALKSFN